MSTENIANKVNAALNEGIPAVALITGAARRVGAIIAAHLHAAGSRVIIHYRSEATEARALCLRLNGQRPDSAICLAADFDGFSEQDYQQFIDTVVLKWNRLDLLVNNASSFFPSEMGTATVFEWEQLFSSNAKAPFFLSQAAISALTLQRGSIVNIIDIHGQAPLKRYPLYSTAKASLWMLTRALAQELAPSIRVNGVAPGAVMWPEGKNGLDAAARQRLIRKIPLQRHGEGVDVARAVAFLAREPYITGQILAVDGGRCLS